MAEMTEQRIRQIIREELASAAPVIVRIAKREVSDASRRSR